MFNGESRARKLYGGNEEEEKEEAVRGDSISSGARTARILLRTVESASSAFAARRDITLCVTLLQEGEGREGCQHARGQDARTRGHECGIRPPSTLVYKRLMRGEMRRGRS